MKRYRAKRKAVLEDVEEEEEEKQKS